MSPVSRKRQKKNSSKRNGRAPRTSRDPMDAVHLALDESLRWTLRTADPLDPELVISQLLGTMRGVDGIHPGVPTLMVDAFIEEFAARATPTAIAALVGFAHLAPDEPSRDLGHRLLRELSQRQASLPRWAAGIGGWSPRRVMVLSDAFGDQANVAVEFVGAGRSHALVALVDFTHLGAWCKDLFVAENSDKLFAAMAHDATASGDLMRFVTLDPAAARFLVERALAATEITVDPELEESFTETRALAAARLRLLPALPVTASLGIDDALRAADLPVPPSLEDPVEVERPERDDLVGRFLDSAPAAALVDVAPASLEFLARLLVDYGCDYDGGRPLRVSSIKLADFLLGWLPRKANLDADDRAAVPAVIGAWVEFAIGRSALPPGAVRKLRAALPDIVADFATEYDNPENFGPARALLDGIGEVASLEELQGLVQARAAEHNARLAARWTYQVRIDLVGARPPIWRRLELPGSTTLAQLHQVLQASFGWDDSHLHQFTVGRTRYGVPDGESIWPADDEGRVTLGQLLERPGGQLEYLYDFGDSWEHRLVVEEIDLEGAGEVAVCTGGRRAAPFEDSGGVPGFERLCAALADPAHPEHAEYAQWAGYEPGAVTFDPAAFDRAALNRALAGLALG